MKVRHLDLSKSTINQAHEVLGLPPVEQQTVGAATPIPLRIAVWLASVLLFGAAFYASLHLYNSSGTFAAAAHVVGTTITSDAFLAALLVGLVAQTVDGALGMAYGITSSTFLLASGFSPAMASASVHIAEVFTTGVSGIAHVRMKNVDSKLFLRLLVPGLFGAVAGAYLVSTLDGKALKPFISAYLLLMGGYLIYRVYRRRIAARREPRHVAKLAVVGGFVDAVGGGGWGPVVTTTLVGSGHDPRLTIGSVNFAEFFLTFASAIAFSLLVEEAPWEIVAGLVLGGMVAAPFAAVLTRRFETRTLLWLVGVLITVVSAFNLYKALA